MHNSKAKLSTNQTHQLGIYFHIYILTSNSKSILRAIFGGFVMSRDNVHEEKRNKKIFSNHFKLMLHFGNTEY